MSHHKDKNGFLFPLLLIILGVFLLLRNFGVIPWGLFEFIGNLWPLLLIVPGILILVKK